MRYLVRFCLVVACLFGAGDAGATDGVIEINSAAAAQGGVTSGDTPGYPVTISQSGSYGLTGSLLTTSFSVSLIEITTGRVSLDLNGFVVGMCVDGGICGLTGTARAIQAGGQDDVRIHNGIVQGSKGSCVGASDRASIENLKISGCLRGISVGNSARIVGVDVSNSESYGIWMGQGSLLKDSVITDSGFYAINTVRSALVIDTVIRGNAGAMASSGFAAWTGGGYRGCVITENDGQNEVQPISSYMKSLGGNFCGSDTICP